MGNVDLSDLIRRELHAETLRNLGDRFPWRLVPVAISGVEVTQAIQYYDSDEHLTDPADRRANNKVPFVAKKAAWVRVYVRSTQLGSVTDVTGVLKIHRAGHVFGPIAADFDISPIAPSTVTADPDPAYAAQRSSTTATLNFIIPADEMIGVLDITAQAWVKGSETNLATHKVTVSATEIQTLKLRGILIHYDGPDGTPAAANLNLAAPTLADLATTAAHFLTAAPVQRDGVFSSAGTLDWGTPLTGVATGPGGCSLEWLALNAALAEIKSDDGNRDDVIYYGLLPVGVPIRNVGGCATHGVTSGNNGGTVTMSHEIGHAAGLQHAACGTPGDPAFPAYEPYDAASPGSSLGEYGLDVDTGAIRQPSERDLMSYCGGRWFSLYHYGKLTNNDRFSPSSIYQPPEIDVPVLVDPYLWPWEYIPDPGPDDPYPIEWVKRPIDMVSIIGIVDRRQKVTITSLKRLTALPQIADATISTLTAELLGKAGDIVSSAPLMRLSSSGCGCGCSGSAGHDDKGPFVFQAIVPASDDAGELRIVDENALKNEDGGIIWSRRPGKRRPFAKELSIEIDGDVGHAKWIAEAGDAGGGATLRFSKDGGKSWNVIGSRIEGNSYRFPTEHIPAGKIVFQIMVSDGFTAASAQSKVVQVSERPSPVAIMHPRRGVRPIEGSALRLLAAVLTRDGAPAASDVGVWHIDGKEVARGRDVWVTAPAAGRHECTFVLSEAGQKSETTTTFISVAHDRQR